MITIDTIFSTAKILSPIARYLRTIARIDASIPTACVGIDHKGLALRLNPDFFASLNPDQQGTVLMHEYLHVLRGHIHPRHGKKDARLWNLATDAVINSRLRQDVENLITFDSLGITPSELPPTHSLECEEEVYRRLTESALPNSKNNGNPLDGDIDQANQGSGNGHGNEIDEKTKGAIADYERLRASAAAREAVEGSGEDAELRESLRDIVPKGHSLSDITKKRSVTTSQVTIDPLVRKISLLCSSVRSRRYTRGYRRERASLPLLGRGISRIPRLLIAIDISGSISDTQLARTQGAIRELTRLRVCRADYTVFAVRASKPSPTLKPLDTYDVGGGTDFRSFAEYANGYDGLIVLTDGEATSVKIRIPTIWAYTTQTPKRQPLKPTDSEIIL